MHLPALQIKITKLTINLTKVIYSISNLLIKLKINKRVKKVNNRSLRKIESYYQKVFRFY